MVQVTLTHSRPRTGTISRSSPLRACKSRLENAAQTGHGFQKRENNVRSIVGFVKGSWWSVVKREFSNILPATITASGTNRSGWARILEDFEWVNTLWKIWPLGDDVTRDTVARQHRYVHLQDPRAGVCIYKGLRPLACFPRNVFATSWLYVMQITFEYTITSVTMHSATCLICQYWHAIYIEKYSRDICPANSTRLSLVAV